PGNPDAAIAPLRRAVALCGPARDAPRLRLAEVLLGQGQDGEAAALFGQVLAHAPDDPQAHLGLARLASRRDDWASSLAHLQHAAASPLTQQRARALLAEVHQRRGDLAAAQRERRLTDDLPPDPEMPDPLLEEVEQLGTGRQAQLARAS